MHTQDGQSAITDIESYIYLLKIYQAMAACDESLKNFVLQDYCPEEHSLKVFKAFPFKSLPLIPSCSAVFFLSCMHVHMCTHHRAISIFLCHAVESTSVENLDGFIGAVVIIEEQRS